MRPWLISFPPPQKPVCDSITRKGAQAGFFFSASITLDTIKSVLNRILGRRQGIRGRRNLTDAWKIELELGNKEDLAEIGRAKKSSAGGDKKSTEAKSLLSNNDKSDPPEPKHDTRKASSLGFCQTMTTPHPNQSTTHGTRPQSAGHRKVLSNNDNTFSPEPKHDTRKAIDRVAQVSHWFT